MIDLYWNKMFTLKFQIEYLSLCYKACLNVKRCVLIFTAIVSSAALAGWINNTEFAFAWGCIIVLMQVISAVYDILPIKKRTDVLYAVLCQLDMIYVEVEQTWNDIKVKDISDEQIVSLIYDYEKKWTVYINKALADDMIPEVSRRSKKALATTKKYMKTILNEELEDESVK